jgi:hypothetical protein
MGRPLKIKKSTTIDIGFNDFGNLTASSVGSTSFTSSQFVGVVGGANASIATSAYPVVACNANINGVGNTAAYIIRQKGATKFLVGSDVEQFANAVVANSSYVIVALGTTGVTGFRAIGADITAGVGDIFTANAAGSGTGTVNLVGQCLLANQANAALLTANTMSITFSFDGNVSNTSPAARLENRFVYSYNASNTANVQYSSNFFNTGNTFPKSGADVETFSNGTGNILTALVTNYTS